MQKPLTKEEVVLIMSDLVRDLSKRTSGRIRDAHSEEIKIEYFRLGISSCESLLRVL